MAYKFVQLPFEGKLYLKFTTKTGPNPSGIRDLRQYSNFEDQKGAQNGINASREKNKNGSHTESVPFIQFEIKVGERQHNDRSPFKSLVDVDRQFPQKLKYSKFNDPNLS